MNRSEAYRVLGVSSGSSEPDVIKKRYRKLMMDYHPDRLIGVAMTLEQAREADTRVKQINKAYKLLRDPSPCSGDPTDDLWLAMNQLQEGYMEWVTTYCNAVPRGIAQIHSSLMAAAVVMNPLLAFNPFFMGTKRVLEAFARADSLDAPDTTIREADATTPPAVRRLMAP